MITLIAKHNHRSDRRSGRHPSRRPTCAPAFTLIEILVVLFLLLILAAIALPNVKELMSDQLVARSARNISSYIDVARNRAISEGRQVGILIERAGVDSRGRSHSIRLRQLTDVPAYTGDASNSFATLKPDSSSTNFDTRAEFDPSDNQLLALSASMVADPSVTGDVDDLSAPIRNGDFIEFPGGRLVPFTITFRNLSAPSTSPVIIRFDLTERVSYTLGGTTNVTALFPSAAKVIPPGGRAIKYKIHRRPVVSTMAPFDLPRGVAIDLNYSGFSVSGNEFAPGPLVPPSTILPAAFNVAIVFGPDGKVVSVSDSSTNVPSPPIGQIFFCLGDSDGVRPDNLFSQENRATATLLNLDSTWIVINSSTGRVVSSPFAPVSRIPPTGTVVTDPTNASLGPAIAEARLLANLSDTVDIE